MYFDYLLCYTCFLPLIYLCNHCKRLNNKFNKSYELHLDLLQYRRENSAEYFVFIIQIEIIKNLTTTTLIKKRIGIGYKKYKKQYPGLEFRFISKLIS